MTRTWTEGDRVAIHDFVGTPYLLGSIVEIRPDGMLRIDLGAQPTAIRYPDDVRVVPADQVPIDERHWVPASVRDQLVRQEAAGRLRAMHEHLQDGEVRHFTDLLADWLDDLTATTPAVYGGDAALVDAARALLTPSPEEVPDAEPQLVTDP